MILPVRFTSSHHSSVTNSPSQTPVPNLEWPDLFPVGEGSDTFEHSGTASPTFSDADSLFGPPAKKPVDISLSTLYKQIRAMPSEIAARMIPRERLVAEILKDTALQAGEVPSRENTFFINLIAKVSPNKKRENNPYLQQSLQKGNSALFAALLKHTEHPELSPLFEIAALQGNADAFGKLIYTAQKTGYIIPKTVLQIVAESGRLDQLSSLMSLSRLSSDQKKRLWKLAQRQQSRINELRALPGEERQAQFNKLVLPKRGNHKPGMQIRRELIALIRAGVDVNYQESEWSDVPLVNAARTQNEVLVKTLLQAGADVAKTDGWKHTALFEAAYNKNDAIFDILIKSGADPDQFVDSKQKTAVNFAAELGYSEVIDKYVEAGADVDIPNFLGDTPILSAAEKGRTKAVQSLIKAGADVNKAGLMGITPLQAAAGSGKTALLNALIKAGADVNVCDNSWETPLARAAGSEDEAAVKLLIESGANPRCSYPLVSAVQRHSLPIAKLLIDAGVDVNAGNIHGDSALYWAEQWGHKELTQLLKDHGAQRVVEPAPSLLDLKVMPPVFPSLFD